MRDYILRERRPDFVFGAAHVFAAGMSRFHETQAFGRDYVRVHFGDPLLDGADLCHVRRDRLGNHALALERHGEQAHFAVP